jgi:hypothetical protein
VSVAGPSGGDDLAGGIIRLEELLKRGFEASRRRVEDDVQMDVKDAYLWGRIAIRPYEKNTSVEFYPPNSGG